MRPVYRQRPIMLPVRLAVLLLLALALGTVSIARLRAAPATQVIHRAAEKHELRSQTTLPFQPLEEDPEPEFASCFDKYSWIQPALETFYAPAWAAANESTQTTEEALAALRGIMWGKYHPGMDEVVLRHNKSTGRVDMEAIEVSKPNQEHKKRCMLGLLADAVQRYSAELTELLGDRTLRLIVETEDFAVVFRGQHWKLPAFAMCTDNTHSDIPVPDFTFSCYPEARYRNSSWPAIQDLLQRKSDMVGWHERDPEIFHRSNWKVGPRQGLMPLLQSYDNGSAGVSAEEAFGAGLDIGDTGFVTVSKGQAHGKHNEFVWLDGQCDHKYLIHTAGFSYSAGLKYKLACGSIVFKFHSQYTEFYEPALQDDVHVVQLLATPKGVDVEHFKASTAPRIRAVVSRTINATEQPPIARQGQAFVREQLTTEALHCYWLGALQRYAELYFLPKTAKQLEMEAGSGQEAAGALLLLAAHLACTATVAAQSKQDADADTGAKQRATAAAAAAATTEQPVNVQGVAADRAAVAAGGGGQIETEEPVSAEEATAAARRGRDAVVEDTDPEGDAGPSASEAGEAAAAIATTPAELEALVQEAAAFQMMGKRKKVVNALIRQAPPADLASGDGDVSTTGACKDSIAQHCAAVKPGAARLASCLREIARAAFSDSAFEGDLGTQELPEGGLGKACQGELDTFKLAAAGNINKNVPAALYCFKDVEQLCADVEPEDPGGVLHCLRKQRNKLHGRCKAVVEVLEQDASFDFRLDFKLFTACAAEKSRLCPNVDNRAGNVQHCLNSQEGSLDWECKQELFRQQMEESDDIRLSMVLMKACIADKRKFCEGVAPGESSVKDCLEDHMYEDGFSDDCRETLEPLIAQRSLHFRLDSVIRTHCGPDVNRLCGLDRGLFEGVEYLGAPLTVSDDSVSKCLQDNRDQLADPACAARVRRVVAATTRDIAFNHPLADACKADRDRLCGKVPRGSSGVVRCLGAKRAELAPACAALLFDTEVSMAESIDFNWPLKEACSEELKARCSGVPHGQGRAIRCLGKAAEAHGDEFSERCKEELSLFEAKAATDYRLSSRLASACKEAVEQSCPNLCGINARKTGCGGSVLHCLGELVDSEGISEECRSELLYYQRMRVRSFGNDAALAEACRGDVLSLCDGVKPERTLGCLHAHRGQLSPACRREEVRLDVMQGRSIELRPAAAGACRSERAAHCGGLQPGKSRVINCLLSKAGSQAHFSPVCLEVLDGLQERRLRDWRTDFQLRQACSADVRSHCAAQNATADALDGGVFQCLVESAAQLSESCSAQVSRAARTALDFYKSPGVPGVRACDGDVRNLCERPAAPGRGAAQPPVGSITACLSKEVELDRQAVEAAVAADDHDDDDADDDDEEEEQEEQEEARDDGDGGERRRRRRRRRLLRAGGDDGGEEEDQAQGHNKSKGKAAGAATKELEEGVKDGQEDGGRREPVLSNECLAFLDVAIPAHGYSSFQDSVTAAALVTQLSSLEASLGLKQGALHNPEATAGKDVLTLNGWAALAGLAALAAIGLALVAFLVRRLKGPEGAQHNKYTLVLKHGKQAAEHEMAQQYDSHLSRR
ncbi:Golgi apparatus protein 1 [Chlorella vulgaris]